MNTQTNGILNGIYLLKSDLPPQQVFNAIEACLVKAEALATLGTLVDLEACNSNTLNNYLWTLSGIIHEANFLYEKVATREASLLL